MLADPMMAQYTGTSAFLDSTAAAISSTAPIVSFHSTDLLFPRFMTQNNPPDLQVS